MRGERLDVILVNRSLAESRERAQRLIMAGEVRVKGQLCTKSSQCFEADVEIDIKQGQRFVSRGGEKLECAFEHFKLNVEGLVCLDVGASTGGFTDCMLQHGAAKVMAVDVGKGQLHWKVRQDPRVTVIDEFNARHLTSKDLPDVPAFVSVDVSFISLTKVLPAVIQVTAPVAEIVTLIKPQFEAGRQEVGKGGVVRDENIRLKVIETIRLWGTEKGGLKWMGVCESPIKGPAGNVEFLAYWKKGCA